MPRWTNNDREAIALTDLINDSPLHGIVVVKLNDGGSIEGVINSIRAGNNAGEDGWRYYGSMVLTDVHGNQHEIDLLDVDKMINVTEERRDDYEKAGHFQSIDFLR